MSKALAHAYNFEMIEIHKTMCVHGFVNSFLCRAQLESCINTEFLASGPGFFFFSWQLVDCVAASGW